MMYNFTQTIFNEPELGQQPLQSEDNFLFLEDLFDVEPYSPVQEIQSPPEAQPHFPSPFDESPIHQPHFRPQPQTDTPSHPQSRPTFKSSSTKNACYNILQKTLKVLKKNIFQSKLEQITLSHKIDAEEFKESILRKRKDFTGPKALSSFLAQKTKESVVFGDFLKWFLMEKYLRMAINEGEMKDLRKYIEFKNLVILPLLE